MHKDISRAIKSAKKIVLKKSAGTLTVCQKFPSEVAWQEAYGREYFLRDGAAMDAAIEEVSKYRKDLIIIN